MSTSIVERPKSRHRQAGTSTTRFLPPVASGHETMPAARPGRTVRPPVPRLDTRARLVEAARSCVRSLCARWGTYDAVAVAIGYCDSSAIRHLMGERGSLLGTVYLVRLSEAAQEHADCYDLAFAMLAPGLIIAPCDAAVNGSLDDERADALVELGRITQQEHDAGAALPAAMQLVGVAQRFVAELRARLDPD